MLFWKNKQIQRKQANNFVLFLQFKKNDSILYFKQYLAVNNQNYEIKTLVENHGNSQQKGLSEKFQHNTFAFNMWDDKICFGCVYSRHMTATSVRV